MCIYIYTQYIACVYIFIYTYSGPTKHIEPHESSFAQSRRPPQECDQQPGYSMAKTCEKPSVQAEKYVSSLEGRIKELQTLQLECNASCVTEHDASNFLGVQNCSNLLFPGAPATIFLYRTVSFLLGVVHVFVTHYLTHYHHPLKLVPLWKL